MPAYERIESDARYAVRSLRKNPEFTAAAILSLALGIAATTAMFNIADRVLLRPLPYAQPERLATISVEGAISAPLYKAFRTQAHSIESAALFTSWYFNLAGEGEPERIPAARVSTELFSLLGVRPEMGRTFLASEDQFGRDNVVLISDRLWKTHFEADPNIAGRKLILNGRPYTVVGVMPPDFHFPEGPEHHAAVGPFPPAEMWRPMALYPQERTCKGCYNFAMLARLRPGVSAGAAAGELDAILDREQPRKRRNSLGVTVLTLQNAVTRKVRTPILLLFGSVTLALLIACVNVANLLLARGLRRREEMAVRLSLGATRGRLVQQGLTEALMLAVCAACVALPLASAALQGVIAIAPSGIPRIASASVDLRMFGFALSLAVVTALLFGAAPAVLAAGQAPGESAKAGGRTSTARDSRLRSALVVAEISLSVVLLVGSALLGKSFLAVSQIPLGFHAENVLTVRTSLPERRYGDQRRAMLIDNLVAACKSLPGVTAAAATSTLPLTGESEGWGLIAEDNPNRDAYTMARVRAVSPGFFRTLGIRLRAGRDFDEHDRGATPVAIVSATAARMLWPGVADPLGRRLRDNPPLTVVGIVDDTHASGIDADVRPYLYVPFWQFSPPEFAIAVRATSDPTPLIAAVKREIWRIDKDQPVTDVKVMKELVADSIAGRRLQAVLMGSFAAFALTLAAIGVYGVLSYSVAQRTREIGIRVALGASRSNVAGAVVWQACVLAVIGIAAGLIAAFELTPLLRSVLYGVGADDKSIFAGCVLLLIAIALAASIIPVRRALDTDPAIALRYE